MKLEGLANTAVTATPARVVLPDAHEKYTLLNDGTGTIYYRYSANRITSSLAGASETVMRAAGGAELAAGDSVVIGSGVPWLDVACITGETATLRIDPGAASASPALAGEAAAAAEGNANLTYSRVVVTQSAAGTFTLSSAVAGKITRVHSLVFVADAAGSWQLQDSNGTALTGIIPITANGGVDITRDLSANGALVATAAGRGINLVTTTSKVFGVALVSVEK